MLPGTASQMPRFFSTPAGRLRILPQRRLTPRTRATPGRLRHTALRLAGMAKMRAAGNGRDMDNEVRND